MKAFQIVAALGAVLSAGTALAAPCDGLIDAAPSVTTPRPVTPLDLARLRDIGPQSSMIGQKLLALSPDRSQAAFVLFRADPDTNRYCSAVVVMGLQAGAVPRILDQGEEVPLETSDRRGVKILNGSLQTVVPVWSPDGKWIAWRKQQNGSTQLWRVPAAGGTAQQVTHSDLDVEHAEWSVDGTALLFATHPALREARKALAREALQGYLYDERTPPYAQTTPLPPGPTPLVFQAVDLATGAVREPRADELAGLPEQRSKTSLMEAGVTTARDGSRAGTDRAQDGDFSSPARLWAERPGAGRVVCAATACGVARSMHLNGLWWRDDGRALVFLRNEGWGNGESALYRWVPETGQVTRLRGGDGERYFGCEMLASELLCAQESPLQPRRLVLIDLESGAQKALFDPNPDFQVLQLGRSERLRWKNDDGTESYSDLVLPPDHVPGRKLPMVVSNYVSRGFLRGGTGDELPIQAFAGRGYAVLSFNKPPDPEVPRNLLTFEDRHAYLLKGWKERKLILAALERGVDLVVRRGIADPAKLGLWGLSDGSSTVQFAIVNRPNLFAAVSAVCGFFEPAQTYAYAGIGVADQFGRMGFPPARGPGSEGWKEMSIALNVHRIRAPVLMQQGEHEFILFLEAYAALRAAGKPAELYSFPGGHHLKWQPAHRLAAYTRNLDWFSFWLKGEEDADPAKAAQYQRWRAMRDAQGKAKSGPAAYKPPGA